MDLGRAYSVDELAVMSEGINSESFSEFMFNRIGATIAYPILDGKVHRISTGNRRDKNAWYIGLDDGDDNSYGVCGDWTMPDVKHVWHSKDTIDESMRIRISELKRKQEEEAKRLHEEASKKAEELFIAYESAPDDHPYLVKKGVDNSCGYLRVDEHGRLVVPVIRDNMLISLQYIDKDGTKRFLKNGETKGGHLVIPGDGSNDKTYLCEGFATGASINFATRADVVVAFNAGNMVEVAKTFPGSVVVADNDESQTGERCAKNTGLKYILIPEVGMDANDYAVAYGLDALKELLEPEGKKSDSWLEHADGYLTQPAPLRWLIKNWIPREGIVMLHGASNSGKTFVALDMMLTFATGGAEWFGNRVHNGNVVYLCGEGHIGMKTRIAGWAQSHKLSSLGNFVVSRWAVDLDAKEQLADAKKNIDGLPWKPDLICIDTLNRFYSGDENSAQEIRGFLASLSDLISTYKCAILLIHHTGVNQDAQGRARGSSALRGAVDTEISVSQEDHIITVEQKKQKDVEFAPPMKFKLNSFPLEGWFDEDGEQVTTAILEEVETDHSELEGSIKVLMEAWIEGDRKADGPSPVLTKEEVRNWMKDNGWSENKIKHAFRNESGRWLNDLEKGGVVEVVEDRIKVADKFIATRFFLALQTRI